MLPEILKPLLWSYNLSKINPRRHKKTILVNAINYGTLDHWRWLVEFYGRETVRSILQSLPIGALKPRARNLARLLFDIDHFHVAPRGTNRGR